MRHIGAQNLLHVVFGRAYFSVQLIAICAVVR